MVIELPADTTDAGVTCTDTSLAGEGEPSLSEADAERLIRAICFKTGPPGTIGAELEWLVRDRADPLLPVEFSRIREVLEHLGKPGALPGAGLLTLEPGGQVELSTAPAKDLSECVAAAGSDLAVLHEAFGDAGLVLTGHGIDPLRRPTRVLELPRYAAMEEYFDRDGHWGRVMMCSTASVQVCVDAGFDDGGTSGFAFRWRLLHALGPVLVAAFANSPLRRGRLTGWKCTRQLVWARLNPGRTRSPGGAEPTQPGGQSGPEGPDVREHWARYALDAEVLCVRHPDGQPWTVPTDLTFRDWLRATGSPSAPGGTGLPGKAGPTADDLSYHLSTLFPPVRPRGHLELRMIDAQHGDRWVVPVAVVAALADDPVAADAAMSAAEPVWHGQGEPQRPAADSVWRPAAAQIPLPRAGSANGASPWLRAASLGLADPALARAARKCFEAAEEALARSGTPPAVRKAVTDFADRYVERGRCPADDVLDAIGNQGGQT
jgi:ergothioneine biosynthesis glutamate--cysteine ligase EgtA